MTDPEVLSGRFAQEALRRVHAEDAVPPDAPLQVRRDPKVPGANFVDASDARYWVGLEGEVVRTADDGPPPSPSADYRRARTRYTEPVERVRLAYSVPVTTPLYAMPDVHVPGAFFVHGTDPVEVVRWVAPGGEVHAGYVVDGGPPQWDDETAGARRALLEGPEAG